MTQEFANRIFEWDHSDRLRRFRQVDGAGNNSKTARYLYAATGERVMKYVRDGTTLRVTTYIDGLFEHYFLGTAENNTLHVSDVKGRIALERVGPSLGGDPAPNVQYQIGDHLGGGAIVIGGDDMTAAGFHNREEYYPYGQTSFGSYEKKRYRFLGKERDEESGLNYHGIRYYTPVAARWLSCDPDPSLVNPSLYQYCRSNPVLHADMDGRKPVIATDYFGKLDALKKDLKITTSPTEMSLSVDTPGGRRTNRLSVQTPGETQIRHAYERKNFDANLLPYAKFAGALAGMDSLQKPFEEAAKAMLKNLKSPIPDKSFGNAEWAGKQYEVTVHDAGLTNMFRHVLGQTFSTALFGAEAADFAGDIHERDEAGLITGKIPKGQEWGATDNYADLANNAYGQALGELLREQFFPTSKEFQFVGKGLGSGQGSLGTVSEPTFDPLLKWNDRLTADFLNAIQTQIGREFGWEFEPFTPDNATTVKMMTKSINSARGIAQQNK